MTLEAPPVTWPSGKELKWCRHSIPNLKKAQPKPKTKKTPNKKKSGNTGGNNSENQNLQYTENFANFTTILVSLRTRGYEVFKQNLAGHTLRNIIRLHHAQSDEIIVNTELCYENMLKECLSYSAMLGCIIGSTLSNSEIKISNYEEVIAIIDKIKSKKAIAKQIPLPKIPLIVIGRLLDKNWTILSGNCPVIVL
ncbi:hypothetical protein RhiirA4_487359 [Rhizophagus irregularis]|uniref:Uncharacterized protein n=1 Tax=Rhizophagus irregularis TaxID=588596 RepID=A0A2I1HSF4_9GLOM|nr:hypothetical protein RhiirA4_487359 [Rhizophagus irregularis]